MEHLAVIMTGLFTLVSGVIVAWFAYNQKSHDKKTDLKIKQIEEETERNQKTSNRNTAIIYGEIWSLLHQLKADRVFIIQPHPETKHAYISVAFEVRRNGVSSIKELLSNIPIGGIANAVKEFASNCWLYYDDVGSQVLDKKVLSLMRLGGATHFSFKQLVNSSNDWIGTLAVESTTGKPFNEDATRSIMKNTANTIQYILPPIN
jgi:uncharacterized protein YxeA